MKVSVYLSFLRYSPTVEASRTGQYKATIKADAHPYQAGASAFPSSIWQSAICWFFLHCLTDTVLYPGPTAPRPCGWLCEDWGPLSTWVQIGGHVAEIKSAFCTSDFQRRFLKSLGQGGNQICILQFWRLRQVHFALDVCIHEFTQQYFYVIVSTGGKE